MSLETTKIIKSRSNESGKVSPKPLTSAYSGSGGNIHNLAELLRDHGDYLILMTLERFNDKLITDEFWLMNELQRLNECKKVLPEVIDEYLIEISN